MQTIGTGFDRRIYDSTGAAAVLYIVVPGLQLELREGIHCRLHRLRALILKIGRIGIVISSIQYEVILGRTVPVYAEDALGPLLKRWTGRVHSGGELSKLVIPASIQRQVRRLLAAHDIADVRGLRVEQRSLHGNIDHLLSGSQLQLNVHLLAVLHIQADRVAHSLLEASRLDSYGIGSDSEVRKDKGTIRSRCGRLGLAGRDVCYHHLRTADYRSSRIPDRAHDARSIDLRAG